jgi:hypothetical protein
MTTYVRADGAHLVGFVSMGRAEEEVQWSTELARGETGRDVLKRQGYRRGERDESQIGWAWRSVQRKTMGDCRLS